MLRDPLLGCWFRIQSASARRAKKSHDVLSQGTEAWLGKASARLLEREGDNDSKAVLLTG